MSRTSAGMSAADAGSTAVPLRAARGTTGPNAPTPGASPTSVARADGDDEGHDADESFAAMAPPCRWRRETLSANGRPHRQSAFPGGLRVPKSALAMGMVVSAPMASSDQPSVRRVSGRRKLASSRPAPAPAMPRVAATRPISGTDTSYVFMPCSFPLGACQNYNRGMRPRVKALNPAGKKHKFGKAWMHEHVSDHWVQEAQKRGYRSRAAFKLIELAGKDRLFRPGMTVVDLGAAP